MADTPMPAGAKRQRKQVDIKLINELFHTEETTEALESLASSNSKLEKTYKSLIKEVADIEKENARKKRKGKDDGDIDEKKISAIVKSAKAFSETGKIYSQALDELEEARKNILSDERYKKDEMALDTLKQIYEQEAEIRKLIKEKNISLFSSDIDAEDEKVKGILKATELFTKPKKTYMKSLEELQEARKEIISDDNYKKDTLALKTLRDIYEKEQEILALADKQGIKLGDSVEKKGLAGMMGKGIKDFVTKSIPKTIFSKLLTPFAKVAGIDREEMYENLLEKHKEKKAKKRAMGFKDIIPSVDEPDERLRDEKGRFVKSERNENEGSVKWTTSNPKSEFVDNPVMGKIGNFFLPKKLNTNPTARKVAKTESAALGTILIHNDLVKYFGKKGKNDGKGENEKGDGGIIDSLFSGGMEGLVETILGGAIGKGGSSVLAGLGSKIMAVLPWAAIATGVLMAVFDGIKGWFKADEWGVSKISGGLGGFLGGTDSGLEGAFKNMGKWALMGAGIGTLIGGPLGTLAGGLIGAALGGIFGWIGGENIAKFFDSIGKWFVDTLNAAWEGIKGIGAWIWDNVFVPIGTGVSSFFSGAWEGIKGIGAWIWENILTPVGNGFITLFSGAWEGIKSIGSWIWDNVLVPVGAGMGNLFIGAWEGMKSIGSWIWENVMVPVGNGFITLFSGAWEGMLNIGQWIWDKFLYPIGSTAFGFISKLGAGVWELGTWIWENFLVPIGNKIGEIFGKIGEKLFDVGSYVWNNVLVPIGNKLIGVFSGAWEGIKSIGSWVWDNVLTPIGSKIGSLFTDAWAGITSGAGNAFEAAKEGLKSAWNWLGTNLFTPIGDFAGNIASSVGSKLSDGFTAAKEGLKSAWGWMGDNIFGPIGNFGKSLMDSTITMVKGGIQDFLKDPVGTLGAVGDKILLFLGPVGEMAKNVKDKIVGGVVKFVDDPVGTIKNFFGSLVEGVKLFVKDPVGFVKDAFTSLIEGIKGFFKPITDYFGYIGNLFSTKNLAEAALSAGKFVVGDTTEKAAFESWKKSNSMNEFFKYIQNYVQDPKDTIADKTTLVKQKWQNMNITGGLKPEEKIKFFDAYNGTNGIPKFHTGGVSQKEQLALLRKDEIVLSPPETTNYNVEQMRINRMLLDAIESLSEELKKLKSGGTVMQQTVINRYSPTSVMNAMSAL